MEAKERLLGISNYHSMFRAGNYPYMIKSAISTDNDFIPLYATVTGTTYTVNNTKILYYELGCIDPGYCTLPRSINNFIDKLYFKTTAFRTSYDNWGYISGSLRGLPKNYMNHSGVLLHIEELNGVIDVIPMLILTIRSRFLYKLDKDNLDTKAFCLVVNKQFTTSIDHSKMYRIVKKNYIDELSQAGIDIIYTDNIDKLCFNCGDRIKLPDNLKTFVDLSNHMKSINNILYSVVSKNIPEPPNLVSEEAVISTPQISRSRRRRIFESIEEDIVLIDDTEVPPIPNRELVAHNGDFDFLLEDDINTPENATTEPLEDLPF